MSYSSYFLPVILKSEVRLRRSAESEGDPISVIRILFLYLCHSSIEKYIHLEKLPIWGGNLCYNYRQLYLLTIKYE